MVAHPGPAKPGWHEGYGSVSVAVVYEVVVVYGVVVVYSTGCVVGTVVVVPDVVVAVVVVGVHSVVVAPSTHSQSRRTSP